MKIRRLMVNGMAAPIGIGVAHPVFSFETDARDGIVWLTVWEEASQKRIVDQTVRADVRTEIRYSQCLREGTCYAWSVSDGTRTVCSRFETGMVPDAPFIGTERSTEMLPLFTRSFFAEARCKKARLYLTSKGLYRAFLNGERVGRQYLTGNRGDVPCFYTQSYDVTDLLWYGTENEIRVVLCGEAAAFSARLVMTDDAGRRCAVCTDPTWRVSESGIVCDRLHGTETQNLPPRDQRQTPCVRLETPPSPIHAGDGAPVTVKTVCFPKHVTRGEDGQVFDFGRTLRGIVRVRGDLPRQTAVRVECSEDGDFTLPTAVFSFVADGTASSWEPIFLKSRFRYARVLSDEKARISVEAAVLRTVDLP